MQRRALLRAGLAAAVLGPGALSLPLGAGGAVPRRRAARSSSPLRLNWNENPLGVPDSAREAVLAGLGEGSRYTDPLAEAFAATIAERHGARPANVVLGNGSTELIQMAVQAVAAEGGWMVAARPTFDDAVAYAGPFGLPVLRVPLRPDHAHDLDGMREAARRAGGPVLAYICNPNNPTGTLTPSAELERWIEEEDGDVTFLVDEAYHHYVDDPAYRSAERLALSRPNVLVLRTFSKAYGLAGLRMGYALGHPDAVRRIAAFASYTNANLAALLAARATLDDRGFVRRSVESNAAGRRILYRTLEELGLEYIPSQANFVMHRVPGDLATYIARMRERDVIVGRPFPPMLSYNRVSIGLPEEMERFAEVLRSFRREGLV